MLLAGIYVLLLPLNDDEGTLTSMQDLTLLGCRVFWLQIVPALFQSSRNLLPSTVLVLVSLPCICRMWGQSFTGLAPAALSMFLSSFVSCAVVPVCVVCVLCCSLWLCLCLWSCRRLFVHVLVLVLWDLPHVGSVVRWPCPCRLLSFPSASALSIYTHPNTQRPFNIHVNRHHAHSTWLPPTTA